MKQGVWSWLVVTSLVGCGGRSLGGDAGANGSANADTGGASHTSMGEPDDSADDPDSGPSGDEAGDEPIVPPDCDEPKVACGHECVDLRSSWEHCGECFHRCQFEGGPPGGKCHLGECQPTYSHCILPSDEFTSCFDVCASLGEACPGPRIEGQPNGCAGANYSAKFSNADFGGCDNAATQRINYDPCETPFDWTQTAAGGSQIPMVGLQCCCTKS